MAGVRHQSGESNHSCFHRHSAAEKARSPARVGCCCPLTGDTIRLDLLRRIRHTVPLDQPHCTQKRCASSPFLPETPAHSGKTLLALLSSERRLCALLLKRSACSIRTAPYKNCSPIRLCRAAPPRARGHPSLKDLSEYLSVPSQRYKTPPGAPRPHGAEITRGGSPKTMTSLFFFFF